MFKRWIYSGQKRGSYTNPHSSMNSLKIVWIHWAVRLYCHDDYWIASFLYVGCKFQMMAKQASVSVPFCNDIPQRVVSLCNLYASIISYNWCVILKGFDCFSKGFEHCFLGFGMNIKCKYKHELKIWFVYSVAVFHTWTVRTSLDVNTIICGHKINEMPLKNI